jgi:hypothetical protein
MVNSWKEARSEKLDPRIKNQEPRAEKLETKPVLNIGEPRT